MWKQDIKQCVNYTMDSAPVISSVPHLTLSKIVENPVEYAFLKTGVVKPALVTTCILRLPLFKDHLVMSQLWLYNAFLPLLREHLYSKTTFLAQPWSLNTGFTVPLPERVIYNFTARPPTNNFTILPMSILLLGSCSSLPMISPNNFFASIQMLELSIKICTSDL